MSKDRFEYRSNEGKSNVELDPPTYGMRLRDQIRYIVLSGAGLMITAGIVVAEVGSVIGSSETVGAGLVVASASGLAIVADLYFSSRG